MFLASVVGSLHLEMSLLIRPLFEYTLLPYLCLTVQISRRKLRSKQPTQKISNQGKIGSTEAHRYDLQLMSMAQPNFKTSLSLCSNDLLAFYFKTVSVIKLMGLLDTRRGGGWGGAPCNALYGKAPPERGIFFRLQLYERVGKSVIWVCERAQRANR